ncbi:MAG: 23S rRNA (pseudouridine(1915)-N(3))-methyltransferase RlmH [Pseudomonadota bacterium]
MRLRIIAIGRMRQGPELDLCRDYLDRFSKAGRGLGFGAVDVIELEDKTKSGAVAEARLIHKALPENGVAVLLDERGKTLTSPAFAQRLAGWRDEGVGDLSFVIGGADGFTPELRARANSLISFGSMVWPHMLARVMLSEQMYRASQILAGTPYHRA